MIKIMIVEPNAEPYAKEVPNTIQSFNEIVGGYIDIRTIPFTNFLAISNKDAAILWLPVNRRINRFVMLGTFFVCKTDPDSEEFASLNESDIRQLNVIFRDKSTNDSIRQNTDTL